MDCIRRTGQRMTKNTFIFSWDMYGIESIISISQYEFIDKENTIRYLKGETPIRNPVNSIVQSLLLRARFNPQRHYEVYAIDCDPEMDEKFWREQWEESPQYTADVIREKGHRLFSDRIPDDEKIKIK